MSNLLKEYIQNVLSTLRPFFVKANDAIELCEISALRDLLPNQRTIKLKDFAEKIGGTYSTKHGYHIRFGGTASQLRSVVGKESKIIHPKMGDPMQRSGKFDTYIFDFTDTNILLPNGEITTTIPIILIDNTASDFLSAGKMLGYGAEHAVYASLNKLSSDQMLANMLDDSRLGRTITVSTETMVKRFVTACSSMSAAFDEQLRSMKLPKLVATGYPPTGGNDLVDVPAEDADGKKYDIHVKYKSDRLVGLQLPKRGQEDKATFAEKLQKHPNKIYRTIRDAMIASPPQGWSSKKPYDIFDIFQNDVTRAEFYAKMQSSGFQDVVNDVLKSALGYNTDATNAVLLVNFKNTTSVDIQKLSSGSKNFDFVVRKPEKENQKISHAFSIDAVLYDSSGRDKIILNVFDLEIGAAQRDRGLDVHKGEGYIQFIDELGNATDIA